MLLLLPQKNHWYLRWFCSIHYENCPKHRYLCSFWTRRYKTLFFALFLRHRHRHVVKIAVLSSLLSPPCPKQTSQKHWRLWQSVAFLHNKKHQKKIDPIFPIFSTCDPPLKNWHFWLCFCHRSSSSKMAFNHILPKCLLSNFLCHNHGQKVLDQNDMAACLDPKIL